MHIGIFAAWRISDEVESSRLVVDIQARRRNLGAIDDAEMCVRVRGSNMITCG